MLGRDYVSFNCQICNVWGIVDAIICGVHLLIVGFQKRIRDPRTSKNTRGDHMLKNERYRKANVAAMLSCDFRLFAHYMRLF